MTRFKRPAHYLVCHNPRLQESGWSRQNSANRIVIRISASSLSQSAWKESNLRPSSYKNAAPTAELHAANKSEVGEIRTLARLGKSQGCFRYTTTSNGYDAAF